MLVFKVYFPHKLSYGSAISGSDKTSPTFFHPLFYHMSSRSRDEGFIARADRSYVGGDHARKSASWVPHSTFAAEVGVSDKIADVVEEERVVGKAE